MADPHDKEAWKGRVDQTIKTLQDEQDTELERHQQRMQELDEEIARVKLEYARIHNAQLPIMLFPQEISLMIFSYLSSSSILWFTGTTDLPSTVQELGPEPVDNSSGWQLPYGISPPTPDSPTIPKLGRIPTLEIIVSHVCHAWRSLALSSPQLWSTFNCEGYRNGWGEAVIRRGSLSWLSAYLERSQERGLNLWFDVPSLSSNATEIMNQLVLHTPRWRRFSMRLQTSRDLEILQSTGPFRADTLETLEIIGQNCGTPFGAIVNASSFWDDTAPKLTALRVACDILEHCLPASVSNITVLQIDKPFNLFSMTWETFHLIIQLPALESLSMADFFVNFTEDLGISHPASSDSLRHFRCTDVSVLCYVLASLRAPCLELLILSNMSLDMDLIQNHWNWQLPFDEHGVRVGPSSDPDYFPLIKTLGFNNCKVYPDKSSLLQVLARATRNVTHIMVAVNKPYWEPNMLIDRNNTVLWPDLETISHSINWNGTPNDIKSAGIDLMKTINRRERHYKKHCTHEIEGTFLEALKSEAGSDFWTSLEEGEFHKVVPINSIHENNWLPWPPREKTDFHYSADNRFNQRNFDAFY